MSKQMDSYSLNERPSEVDLAIAILWAKVFLAIVGALVAWYPFLTINPKSILFPFFVLCIVLGWAVWIISAISVGKNWARLFLLGLVLFGFCSAIFSSSKYFSGSTFHDIAIVLQDFMQISAVAALFAPNSNRWFE
jgi:hypothetical protein